MFSEGSTNGTVKMVLVGPYFYVCSLLIFDPS